MVETDRKLYQSRDSDVDYESDPRVLQVGKTSSFDTGSTQKEGQSLMYIKDRKFRALLYSQDMK